MMDISEDDDFRDDALAIAILLLGDRAEPSDSEKQTALTNGAVPRGPVYLSARVPIRCPSASVGQNSIISTLAPE